MTIGAVGACGGGDGGRDGEGEGDVEVGRPPADLAEILSSAGVAVVDAPGSRPAGSLVGDETWADAPAVVFPSVVLALFVADLAALSEELGWPAATAEPQGFRRLGPVPAATPGGVCSTLAGWVSDVIGTVFDALTVESAR